ncbi:MAG: UvrD-helicase domain-containing protein [Propionibacteriaceae bacterium]|nr:UvrD-helicase domain-containing protein [Propionibacteriaceae bacterium]
MSQSALDRELEEEQEYVNLVLTHLRNAVTSAKGLVEESKARFMADRETWMREENTTALFERDAFAYVAARRIASLENEHQGLVFGRLDFVDTEKRYIGRLGVRTHDYEPLVIDWRAQAAEPFYRATPSRPMDVVRRRVLTSRDDRVTGIEDDVLMPTEVPEDMTVVGDGALISALERARGPKMHDIVATIQAEQDEVIRAPLQGFTLITGGPGTGKTVVGLHRVAFLIYTYRNRLTNGGVLVIGPSSIFIDYIERVLPSLGEDSVTLKSVDQVADDVLGFTCVRRDTEDAWVIKGGAHMAAILRRLIEYSPIEEDKTWIIVKGEPLLITRDDLIRIRKQYLGRTTYNQARSKAEAHVISLLWGQGEKLVDLEGPDKHEEFEDLVRDSWTFQQLMNQWWPSLEPTQILSRLADPNLVRKLGDLTENEIHTLASSIDSHNWSNGDIPLLDELADLLGPVEEEEDSTQIFYPEGVEEIVTISDHLTDHRHIAPKIAHTTYAHILIDEAQDITPMQWRMIYRRGSQASWTIVGDPAQSSWPDRDEPLRTLSTMIGRRQQRSYRLSTNYRSPKEVYDLATRYICAHELGSDIPEAVRSTGIAPRLLVSSQESLGTFIAEQVSSLLAQVEGTVAVICESQYTDLVGASVAPNPRVILLNPLSCKGLEFDAVVVIDPDSIASRSASGARILYVVLTRPTQILVTIDIDHEGQWRPS